MTTPTSYRRRSRSRGGRLLGILCAVLLLAGGGYAAYALVGQGGSSGDEDPQVVAAQKPFEAFLKAWEKNDASKAASYTDTPDNAESLIKSVMTNLKPSRTGMTPGNGQKKNDGEVHIPFAVEMTLPGAGDFDWDSRARVIRQSDTWVVEFTSPMIHPKLEPGQTLALKSQSNRAKVLDKNGDDLQAASLVGTVDEVSGKGASGLEARYDETLSGGKGAGKSVVVADRRSGSVVKSLDTDEPAEGQPVRTTIDPRIQQAAAKALSGVEKTAAIVAVDSRNGHILAVANQPGGLNRALEGRYPPGSTFKVVTAAALLRGGVRPTDPAACPKFARVDGQRFENQDQFDLPAGSTFGDAFTQSCNTFFVNARADLTDTALRDAALAFGIGGSWDVGATTYDGSVPVNTSNNDKAAATIGQARVQASPLVMASIAATVQSGKFTQPTLVPDAVKKKYEAPVDLDADVAGDLRDLMRATVTSGSARTLKDLPGRPHAKSGTAEFGTEAPPRTHAWMIGYQGDSRLSWAVLLEDGGSGGSDAGPVAAEFLRNVG